MEFEAAYNPDGSVAAWLCWRLDRYVGSVCHTGPGRWQANDADGAVIGVGRTRKAAFEFVMHQYPFPNEAGGATSFMTIDEFVGEPDNQPDT